jgi:hypothetical protein
MINLNEQNEDTGFFYYRIYFHKYGKKCKGILKTKIDNTRKEVIRKLMLKTLTDSLESVGEINITLIKDIGFAPSLFIGQPDSIYFIRER